MRETPFGYQDSPGKISDSITDKTSPERAKKMFSAVAELAGLSRFEKALVLTSRLHAMQDRKGEPIPYLMHPMAVASLVLAGGGGEDEAIAGLLHDSIEDQDADLADIEEIFGSRVAKIVMGCTDVPAEELAERSPENSEARKVAYLEELKAETDPDIFLVSVADKLHNCRSILNDYRQVGESFWGRFNVSREVSLWYYKSLAEILTRSKAGVLGDEFGLAVKDLLDEARNHVPGADDSGRGGLQAISDDALGIITIEVDEAGNEISRA